MDAFPNHHYDWRPAISTGVTFQKFAVAGQQLGGGFGANMVLVPDAAGKTAPWPAITFHFGTRENGFFVGLILSPTDGVVIPGDSMRLQRDNVPNFTVRNTGRSGHLYVGIRIGGKNQSLSPVSKIDLSPIPTVPVGQTYQVALKLFDLANNELRDRECKYESSNPAVATIDSRGLITAKSAGSTTIKVTCEGAAASTTLTVP